MDVQQLLREARARAGLTQAQLAARAGTSQATLSSYERGLKQPSAATLGRLVEAAGSRLVLEHGADVRQPSRRRLARAGRELLDVLALAEALPVRHHPELRFPRLPTR